MITSVQIDNFRCFKKLQVDGLSRVNLIVGANNSGKTVLLEAIEAVASRESPLSFTRASIERGEIRRRSAAHIRPGETGMGIDLRHWFHGHRLVPDATLTLRAAGDREILVSRTIQAVPSNAPSPPFIPGGIQLSTDDDGIVFPLTEDGWLPVLSTSTALGLRLHPPVGFVTTGRFLSSELASLWADVVLTPGEAQTVEALRLVEPAIDRIAISESEGTIAQVLLRGAERPVPLGTLGEGVSRILTIALHLVLTQDGYLLIDEIENGLHWSVMPKVWRFLIETAIARNVQVFATTHSKDWLEGLADLHRAHPKLAEHVSVHRLEAGRETSVRFDAGRIAEYVELELEAR